MQEKTTLNDKATFKHETEEQYLYYMTKGKGVWMVNEHYRCTLSRLISTTKFRILDSGFNYFL